MSQHVIDRYSIMSFQGVVKVDEKRHSFIVHLFSTMTDKRDIFSFFFCSRRISDPIDVEVSSQELESSSITVDKESVLLFSSYVDTFH